MSIFLAILCNIINRHTDIISHEYCRVGEERGLESPVSVPCSPVFLNLNP